MRNDSAVAVINEGATLDGAIPARGDIVSARNPGLDFVRGVLVLAMLAYHVGSFFIADRYLLSKVTGLALSFVSGSWVFLSGLLVSYAYERAFPEVRREVAVRFLVRGIKLLGVFVALNLCIVALALPPASSTKRDFTTLGAALLYGGGEESSFEILVGIAYVMILSPLLLWARSAGRLLSVMLVSAGIWYSIGGGVIPPNLWLVLCGLAGISGGYVLRTPAFTRLESDAGLRSAALACTVAVALAHYVLLGFYDFGRNDLHVYLLGVVSIVSAIYFSYPWMTAGTVMERGIRLIGRHSLACYIGQMAILWSLRLSASALQVSFGYWSGLALSLSVMIVMIVLLDRAMERSESLKRVYQLFLG